MNDIRLLIEGTAPKAVIRTWEEDFNAGAGLDPEEVRAWVIPRFEQVAALASPDAAVARRHAAVFALGCARDPRGVRPLIDVLVTDHHRYDHDFVAMAFRRIGNGVVPALVAELPSRNALRTGAALVCLGHIEDVPVEVWREIGPTYADYPELYVAIHNQNRSDLVSIARLGLDRPKVRMEALMALSMCAMVASDEGTDNLSREEGLADQLAACLDPLGHRALDDPDASCWSSCVGLLANLKDPRAFDAAVRALDDTLAPEGAIHSAISVLGQLGSKAAKDRLRVIMRGKDPALQALAAEGVGLEDAEARQTVLSLAAELRVDSQGWWEAMRLVGELPDGVDVLASWVDTEKPRSRRSRSAIRGLAELSYGDPDILDGLQPQVRALVEAQSR